MSPANDNVFRKPKPIPKFTDEEQVEFWIFVDKSGGPDACWPWQRAVGPYGRVVIRDEPYQAHRVAYSIANDERLEDCSVVRHKCDNPPCCNPNHLISGTYAQNTADMMSRNRDNPARGEQHPRAVVTEELASEIRSSPLSGRKAAIHFGVSYGLVANIKAGRTWKHAA